MEDLNFELIQKIRAKLNQEFPLGLILRTKLEPATGGLLKSRTEANNDCLGCGIKDPVMVGKHVCYHVERVVEYLERKISKKISKEAV